MFDKKFYTSIKNAHLSIIKSFKNRNLAVFVPFVTFTFLRTGMSICSHNINIFVFAHHSKYVNGMYLRSKLGKFRAGGSSIITAIILMKRIPQKISETTCTCCIHDWRVIHKCTYDCFWTTFYPFSAPWWLLSPV